MSGALQGTSGILWDMTGVLRGMLGYFGYDGGTSLVLWGYFSGILGWYGGTLELLWWYFGVMSAILWGTIMSLILV